MKRGFLLAALILAVASPLLAQVSDPLGDVRALYESAAYEEALAELGKLPADAPASRVEQYRAFCLIALGRVDEASAAVARAVTADPLLLPSGTEASPRVRAFFTDARRKILPDITREAYAQAKAAYGSQDFATARTGFQRVVTLTESAAADGDGAADLRLLAQEFLELSNRAVAAAASAAAAAAAPRVVPGPSPAASAPVDASTAGERRGPVAILQKLPSWTRQDAPRNSEGRLRIQINEEGIVTSAVIVRVSDPAYDSALLAAAKEWKYQPAMSNGKSVPSEKEITYILKRQPD